jgi:hypothetical protein
LEEICDGNERMPRSRKITEAEAVRILHEHIHQNAATVVKTLNDIGLWHVSPCTDVGFKHTLGDDSRAIRVISLFNELLDAAPCRLSCRMLDRKKILEGRSVTSIEKIPESIGHTGEVTKKQIEQGGKDEGSVLPKHPKIDSGFIVTLSDKEIYKMGIEMQAEDKGNMLARGVDYGSRIFRYKGENKAEGSVRKVFELLLNRWGITSASNKLISCVKVRGSECDKDVGEGLVDKVCLCCVSLFLGKSIDIVQQIVNYLGSEGRAGSKNIDTNDQEAIRGLIGKAMRKERRVLSKQVMIFAQPGKDVSHLRYRHLDANGRKLVDRLGFFKYGHLMSQEDVDALGDKDLKNDYQCIKIQEENVMENIDQVSAIWGTLNPYNDTTMAIIELQKANQDKDKEIQNKDKEIARLKEQLAQVQPKATLDRELTRRHPEATQQKQKGQKKNSNPSPTRFQEPKRFPKNRQRQWRKK